MPRCLVCKGSGKGKVTMTDLVYVDESFPGAKPLTFLVEGQGEFTRWYVENNRTVSTYPCDWCDATGYMTKDEREKYQTYMDQWCTCSEESRDPCPGWDLTFPPESEHMRSWMFCLNCGWVIST